MGVLGSFLGGASGALGQGLVNEGLNRWLIEPRQRKIGEGILGSIGEAVPGLREVELYNQQIAKEALMRGEPVDPSMLKTFDYSTIDPNIMLVTGGPAMVRQLMENPSMIGGVDTGKVTTQQLIELDKAYANTAEQLATDFGIPGMLQQMGQGTTRPAIPGRQELVEGATDISMAKKAGDIESKRIDITVQNLKNKALQDNLSFKRDELKVAEQKSKEYNETMKFVSENNLKSAQIQQKIAEAQTDAKRKELEIEKQKIDKRGEIAMGKAIEKMSTISAADLRKNYSLIAPNMFRQFQKDLSTGEIEVVPVPLKDSEPVINRASEIYSQLVQDEVRKAAAGEPVRPFMMVIQDSLMMAAQEMQYPLQPRIIEQYELGYSKQTGIPTGQVGVSSERIEPPAVQTGQPAPEQSTASPSDTAAQYADVLAVMNSAPEYSQLTDEAIMEALVESGYDEKTAADILKAYREGRK